MNSDSLVPIAAAKDIAEKYGQKQVIVFTYDGKGTTAITYGESVEDSAAAAEGANFIKKGWKWPENTIVESAKVQALRDAYREVEAECRHWHTEATKGMFAEDRFVIARETAVYAVANSRPELGYTIMSGWGIFNSREDARKLITMLNLPLGWVVMPLSQLLTTVDGTRTPPVE